MNATETIAKMIEDSKKGPVNHWTGAGTPWRYAVRILNGQHVQANVLGWGEGTVQVWLNKSTEPLSIEEAAARIAA